MIQVLQASLLALGWAMPAQAQTSEADQASSTPQRETAYIEKGDIVVLARKRQESILKVPVVVTAVQGEKLLTLGATEMTDLPKLVPGLNLSRGNLSAGLFVTIRGVGTSSQDPSIDQSVSLNIDGLPLTQGLAFASGMFDLGQIEVLKGPQALFYGKASPGGVIALRSADPTDELEVMARVGYEFEANERRGELIVSGPLTDTLKARVAGNYSAARGYFRNVGVAVPGTGAIDPRYSHLSRSRNYHVRGTLLWEPLEGFTARLKANLVRDSIVNPEAFQLRSCPQGRGFAITGLPPFIAGDDCKLNRSVSTVYADPQAFGTLGNDIIGPTGIPTNTTRQRYGTLELNYDLTPQLSLTSTTGYYRMRTRNAFFPGAISAGTPLNISQRSGKRDVTQELRLNSDFSGPLNVTLGAYYQDSQLFLINRVQGNRAYGLAPFDSLGRIVVDTKAYSLFGQLRWKITPELELAGGTRWTDESKKQSAFNIRTNSPIFLPVTKFNSKNFAPEATLTYTPTDDLTVFAALKQAYKSGGFGAATVPFPGTNNSYRDEKVRGGEVGVKSRLFDRQLQANIAAYYYKFTGLQVGAIEQPPPGQAPSVRIINAGAARVYGIDFDAGYRPDPIEGLEINASINWNNSRYTDLQGIPCWTGQTIALGCNQIPDPRVTARDPLTGAQLFTSQDVSGTPMIRAAKWQANFGFSYEIPVGSDYKLLLSNSNQYSSRFTTFLAINRPNHDDFQPSFLKSDVSLALRGPRELWEVALIAKNITDKVTSGLCSAGNYAGGLFLSSQFQGGTTSGASGVGQVGCYAERGRSVWVRVTLKPFN